MGRVQGQQVSFRHQRVLNGISTDDNNSWNCGAEGPSDDPGVIGLRHRLAKNHVCMLLFSCGTPMLLGGDEFLRTQGGNNNAYCQDNELAWFDWDDAARNAHFTEFVRKAIALTRVYPVLQRRRFLGGESQDGGSVPDIAWFGPNTNVPRWDDPETRVICFLFDGPLGFVYNCDFRLQDVTLPPLPKGRSWRRIIDTSMGPGEGFAEQGAEVLLDPQTRCLANPRSVVVLVGR